MFEIFLLEIKKNWKICRNSWQNYENSSNFAIRTQSLEKNSVPKSELFKFLEMF
jgi:hypothetical protein